MKSTTNTSRKVLVLLTTIVGALLAVSGANAGGGSYGPPDGWMTRALEGSRDLSAADYGQPDGWMTRALQGPRQASRPDYGAADGWINRALVGRPIDSRDTLSTTARYGEPDGWMTRALESSTAAVYHGPHEDASRLALGQTEAAYGELDGWMARALEGSYGEPDGWTTRALEGSAPAADQAPREDASRLALGETIFPYGEPDGWTARATERAQSTGTRFVSGSRLPISVQNATTASSGFDFTDAAIGSAATLAALLLIGIPLTMVRRNGAGHLAG